MIQACKSIPKISSNELHLNLTHQGLDKLNVIRKNLKRVGFEPTPAPTTDVSPVQWLRRVFTGDAALTTWARPS